MEHSFDIEVAKTHGVTAAILYRNFQYWITKNKANGHNLRDGRTWTYNSLRALADQFPYLSVWDVRQGLEVLINTKVLLKSNYNSKASDKTSWYAFADEKTSLKGLPDHLWNSHRARKTHTSICESHKPLPNPIPNTIPDKSKGFEVCSKAVTARKLQHDRCLRRCDYGKSG